MRSTAGSGLVVLLLAGCGESSSEMEVVVVETGVVTDGPISVGNNLSFDLSLRVGDAPGPFEAPADLEVVPEDASALRWERVDAGSTDQETLLRLTPLSAGSGSVRFFADNAVEDPTFRYEAVEVDTAEITCTVQGAPDSETTADEMTVFVGSRVFVEAAYEAGGARILGREVLEVDAPDDASTEFLDLADSSLPQLLDIDTTPHDATVTSPATGDTVTFHALDATGIWLTELVVNGEPFDAEAPFEMTVGEEARIDLVANSRPGARIWGVSPTPAEWELHGDSVSETGRDVDGLIVTAGRAGTTTIVFTYGAAQAAIEIAVSN